MEKNMVFDSDSRLMFDSIAYKVKPYTDLETEFSYDSAYLYKDKFYLYKGDKKIRDNEPGIYLDNGKFKLVETDDEKYNWDGKIGTLNPEEIIKMINNKEVVILNFPDIDQSELPEIKEDDDILKRLIKNVIREKRINIDAYKTRFPDKNALFNFKQVIKGDGRLSMLLFDRAMEAFNLKYTIIIEESQPEELIIGIPMEGRIVDTSNASYEI